MKVKDETVIQIGELAKKLNITTRTIRYYEEISLMDPPRRLEGGIRVYDKENTKQLRFILKLKDLGISLKEMQELKEIYSLNQGPVTILPRLLEILDNHLRSIDGKIYRVTLLRKEIVEYRIKIVEVLMSQD